MIVSIGVNIRCFCYICELYGNGVHIWSLNLSRAVTELAVAELVEA